MMFREHRGGLPESLRTMVRFKSRADLIAHCRDLLWPYEVEFTDEQFHVDQYMRDNRINPPWDTHIVHIDGYGVMGFTDGPV